MTWAAMVVAALALWAWSNPGPIRVIDADAIPAYANVTAQAWADPRTVPGSCTISVKPSQMAYMTDQQRQRVITHEVGHCAGLEHDRQHEGIMYPDGSQYEFSGWDRINFWRVHPPTYHTAIVGIAMD